METIEGISGTRGALPADLSMDGHPLCPMVASVCFWTGLCLALLRCLWSIPAPILFGHDVTKDSTPES